VDVRTYTDLRIFGGTRDDAAGECFDKIARVLGLPYPGGAAMDKLAQGGDDTRFAFPRVQIADAPYEMSFSGIKTYGLNLMHKLAQNGEELPRRDFAASFSKTVSDMLVPRVLLAARARGYGKVAAVGGVAANSRVRGDLERACRESGNRLYLPPLSLCGDNGGMIGSQAYYEFLAGNRGDWSLNGSANRAIDA
jgi:N6-L-threonylcarbamoyladenine synthase